MLRKKLDRNATLMGHCVVSPLQPAPDLPGRPCPTSRQLCRSIRLRHNSKRSSACDSPLRTLPDAATPYAETPTEISPSGPRGSPPVSYHTGTSWFPYDPETWSAAEVPSHPGST